MSKALSHQIASATGLLLLMVVACPPLWLCAEWLRYPEDNALSSIAASVAQFIGGL